MPLKLIGSSTGWAVCFRAARAEANRASCAAEILEFELVREGSMEPEGRGGGGGGGGGAGKGALLLIGRFESLDCNEIRTNSEHTKEEINLPPPSTSLSHPQAS